MESSRLPAAAPARAPYTAAAPETAPRRGSAGGTWCRHRAPPCPARAELTAAPPAGPPLYLTVSSTTWRRRPAAGCGGRAGAGGPRAQGRALQCWAAVRWFAWTSIKRKGAERGVPDRSDSVRLGLRHCDARGRDYVKRSHAGAPPEGSLFRRGSRKPSGSAHFPAAAPPSLRLSRAASAFVLLAILREVVMFSVAMEFPARGRRARLG